MSEQLDNVISAYLSPDKKTSLSNALDKVEDLDALVEAARARCDELFAKPAGELSQKEVEQIQVMTEIMVAGGSRKAEAVKAAKDAESKESQIADLKEKAAQAAKNLDTKKDDDDADADVQQAAKTNPVEEQKEESQTEAVAESKELVGAGASTFSVASKRSISSLPSTPPPPQRVTNKGLSTTYAADSAGVVTDRRFESMDQIASAVISQLGNYPVGVAGNDVKNVIAVFKRDATEEFSVWGRDDDEEIISKVAAKGPVFDRQSGQFAAGWCAPSENIYELCPYVTSTDGIWDVPEVVARRGGVRYTTGPNFATIYGNSAIGQVLTEAQVAAGTAKTCIEIDCPSFTEVRLDVNPLCITGNLLSLAGYPEYVERFIRESIAANLHKINLELLTRAVTASTAVNTTALATGPNNDVSATSSFLEFTSWYAVWLRNRYRTVQNQVIEVVAPYWLYELMQDDLVRRTGVDLLVAGDRINAAFAARNIRVQWVYDWQPMAATAAGAVPRPLTAQVLVYIPGTFTKLAAPVINLGTIHSAAQLVNNQYTALFVEEGFNLIERCFESLVLTVNTCPSGTTGAANVVCDVTP